MSNLQVQIQDMGPNSRIDVRSSTLCNVESKNMYHPAIPMISCMYRCRLHTLLLVIYQFYTSVMYSILGVIQIVSYEIRIVHIATYVFAVVGNNFHQQR